MIERTQTKKLKSLIGSGKAITLMGARQVGKYISVLEKSYIIFRLGSFSRNLRNELKTSRKIYFWDLGIRNAVIGNFSSLENRPDCGAMWENLVISERLKGNEYASAFTQSYFWRTKDQSEIDYVEENDGEMTAFEFKWNSSKSGAKCPESFARAYPEATFKVITPENIEAFLPM